MIDLSGEFGTRVAGRLAEEIIIWLTTVRADGTPQPSPVWFLWADQQLLIYSQANKQKLRNIQHNPKVALNFDGNGRGGNIVVITGEARIDPHAPPADQVAAYIEKYRNDIARIGRDPESFAKSYSVAIWVTPTSLRGF
jgi:PPOX class probable F420-dependent enzyme